MATELAIATVREALGWLEHRTGLSLTERPLDVILGKIERAAVAQGYDSLEEFCSFIRGHMLASNNLPQGIFQALVDHLTVTETFFFRGEAVLQRIVEEKISHDALLQGKISIWSAACATGEEPYTVAMLMLEKLPFLAFAQLKPPIIATDINQRALERAKAGVYARGSLSLRSIPEQYLRFFERLPGNLLRTKPEVQRLVEFSWVNLACEETWPSGEFDICLLRNVLYYFNEPVRKMVVDKIKEKIKPGGVLILGETEQLPNDAGFETVSGSRYLYYVKR